MRCKSLGILIPLVVIAILGDFTLAVCPSGDFTGNCVVNFQDFALMANLWSIEYNWKDLTEVANHWLNTDPCVLDNMAYIPAGEFDMGDHLGNGWADELPIHQVLVDSLLMSKFEITNWQYCDYLNSAILAGKIKLNGGIVYDFNDTGNNFPYCDTHISSIWSQIDYNNVSKTFNVRTKGGRDISNDPMVNVSWCGSVAYCNWRSSEEGYGNCYNIYTWDCDFTCKGYRLPTEAEWEYAARDGKYSPYCRFPWSDNISHNEANYYADPCSYSYDVNPTDGFHRTWYDGIYPYTSPAGSFPANSFGVYDMVGNVWEWCNDWYSRTYYSSSPPNKPTGPTNGTYRVLRGGSWNFNTWNCRSACRYWNTPDYRGISSGFRVILDLN